MAGYDDYSMSNNAREAYRSGEMPLSKWTKTAILEDVREKYGDKHKFSMDVLQRLPLVVLRKMVLAHSSWHHTSKMYNRTDFWCVDDDALEELTDDILNQAAEKYRSAPNNKATPAIDIYRNCVVEWTEWSGTRNHPKATHMEASGCTVSVKGKTATVTLPDGKEFVKRLGTNGFAFKEELKNESIV